jgi:hypothetical protein
VELTWRRFCWIVFGVSLVLAAVGVIWYALSPGVGSYQASTLLTLPAVLFVLVWLHGRLPMWLQWTVAWPLALVGPIGYLVFSGSQWWNWGQLTPLPLVLLAISRTSDRDDDDDCPPLMAGVEGPWGPP